MVHGSALSAFNDVLVLDVLPTIAEPWSWLSFSCRMQECEGVSFSTSYHGIKQLLSLLTSQHPSITFYLFHSSRFTAGFFDNFFKNKMKLKFVYGWPTKRLGFEDPRFMVGCQAEISCKCRKAAKCLKCQLFHFTACDWMNNNLALVNKLNVEIENWHQYGERKLNYVKIDRCQPTLNQESKNFLSPSDWNMEEQQLSP